MTTELIGTLFLSEKRKNLMIYLMDGPRTIDEIKTKLNVTTSAIMTQIKLLMNQGLIIYSDNLYSLTVMGRVISEKMIPLLETLEMYSENQHYWDEHNLSALPHDILSRLSELKRCFLVEPEMSRLYEPPRKFEENLFQSRHIYEISSFFSPIYHSAYMRLAKQGIEIEIVLSPLAFERFKEDYTDLLKEYMLFKNVSISVCKEKIEIASSVVTDHFFSISLFSNSGIYHNHSMMSFENSAIRWGKDLFLHYLGKSEKMTMEHLDMK
ncbi:MAG: winged helix-turn-helix domain-containing protein [Methanimicrococcus sp.]|nr:winged helix-turn-helix domain-containing protein [Methanimicrococcus sp.]